jgi:hypothetical protein
MILKLQSGIVAVPPWFYHLMTVILCEGMTFDLSAQIIDADQALVCD